MRLRIAVAPAGGPPYRSRAVARDLSAHLAAARDGDPEAFAQAYAAAYEELRRVARRQLRALRPGDTVATTALVNEAFLKLVRHPAAPADRTHFFALAARAMRQILVDYARQRQTRKRGGAHHPTTLDEGALSVDTLADEMLAIDQALGRLQAVDPSLARLVECRFFGGMTEEEIAQVDGVHVRTVRRDWQKARAFLYRELQTRR